MVVTTQTRNEAAERLRNLGLRADLANLFDEALAAERRATAHRIRDRIFGMGGFYVPDPEDNSENVPVVISWHVQSVCEDEWTR